MNILNKPNNHMSNKTHVILKVHFHRTYFSEKVINSYSTELFNYSHLKLCLATAIHNFKWLKNYLICEI